MSKLTEYTIELYKVDKRIKKEIFGSKNKVGLRFVEVRDFAPVTKDYIAAVVDNFREGEFVAHVYETYVTRQNMMDGREFKERYDTPSYCSPSSESYWSM